jgi:hypothetical protein
MEIGDIIKKDKEYVVVRKITDTLYECVSLNQTEIEKLANMTFYIDISEKDMYNSNKNERGILDEINKTKF